MSTEREEQIRTRAYEIWEREGRPEGRHEANWTEAERAFSEAGRESGAGAAIEPGPSEQSRAEAHPSVDQLTPERAAGLAGSQAEFGSTRAGAEPEAETRKPL